MRRAARSAGSTPLSNVSVKRTLRLERRGQRMLASRCFILSPRFPSSTACGSRQNMSRPDRHLFRCSVDQIERRHRERDNAKMPRQDIRRCRRRSLASWRAARQAEGRRASAWNRRVNLRRFNSARDGLVDPERGADDSGHTCREGPNLGLRMVEIGPSANAQLVCALGGPAL